jgi:hypothetical protein
LGVYSIGYCGKLSYEYVSNCYVDTKTELFLSLDPTPLDFCLWGLIKREVYKRKVDMPDELLARILYAAARVKKRADQLRQTTRELQSVLRLTVGIL